MVCTPFALQGCDPGSKTLFTVVLMQVSFRLDNQEEYGQCQEPKGKEGNPVVGSGSQTNDLPYLPATML